MMVTWRAVELRARWLSKSWKLHKICASCRSLSPLLVWKFANFDSFPAGNPCHQTDPKKNPSKPDSHIKWRSNDQFLWVHWFLIFDPWPNMLFKTRFHVDLGVVMDLSRKYNTFELPKKQVYCKHSASTNETTRNQQIGPTCAFHTVHHQWIYSTLSNLVLYQLPLPPC